MSDVSREILDFWERTKAAVGVEGLGDWPANTVPDVSDFGDGPELSDRLLGLVLSGVKTGTSATIGEYEAYGETIPNVGDLVVFTDWQGVPRALVRETAVVIVPFDEVTAKFAYTEGEDDRSLESWREGHERYWRRSLPQGLKFDPKMLVVCENFEVIYQEAGPSADDH